MPRVPTYNGPQLRSNALQGGMQQTVDADAFGAAGGRQLSQAGQALGQAADAFDRVAEKRALEQAFEIENKVAEAYTERRAQWQEQRQLGNATGVAKEVQDWWTNDAPKIVGNVDERTKRALNRSLTRRREQSIGEFTQFEAAQRDKVGEINYETMQTREARDAANFIIAGNEAEGNLSVAKIRSASREYLIRKGVPPDAIDEEVRKREGKIHSDVIGGLLQADPKRAKEYFNRPDVKGSFSRTARAEIENQIATLVDAQEGATVARTVIAEVTEGRKHYDAFDYTGADARLVEKFKDNPNALKAARSELDRGAALWQRQQAEIQSAGVQGAYEMLRGGAGMRNIMASPAWQQMSPQQRDQFSQEQENRWRAAQARSVADRERAERAEELRTVEAALVYSDPNVLSTLSAEDVRNLRPVLGERNYERVAKAWNDFSRDQVKLSNAKFDNDMFNEVMLTAGIDPKPRPKDKEGAATIMRARSAMEAEIAAEQRTKNRELTAQEKREISQRVMARTVMFDPLFGSKREVPAFSVNDDKAAKAFVEVPERQQNGAVVTKRVKIDQVPTQDVVVIKQFLKDKGLPDNDANVLAWYARQQKNRINQTAR